MRVRRVYKPYMAIVVDKDVLELDVAVNDSNVVHDLQSTAHQYTNARHSDASRKVLLERTLLQIIRITYPATPRPTNAALASVNLSFSPVMHFVTSPRDAKGITRNIRVVVFKTAVK